MRWQTVTRPSGRVTRERLVAMLAELGEQPPTVPARPRRRRGGA